MPEFQYTALSQTGEIVTGSIEADSRDDLTRRIEYLGLIPIEGERRGAPVISGVSFGARASAEDVTIMIADLALLLKTGARIHDALDLMSKDASAGRLRPTLSKVAAAVASGDSFADALARHPAFFAPMYVALCRAGESSGSLDTVLETLAAERQRAEALRRRLLDALRYPAFILAAAGMVLLFFLIAVLPQFESVLRDFNARIDPVLALFLSISAGLRAHLNIVALATAALIALVWWASTRRELRSAFVDALGRIPLFGRVLEYRRAALFCRNLGLLLTSGVGLAPALRIIVDIMASTGKSDAWTRTVDFVRHGGKLSQALMETGALPQMAVRTLRLGEESGRLPMVLGRIADFYEAKLQRSLDRIVAVVGPASIIAIALVVGGLIVSVMTALLSVNQLAG
ncbi:MAG: type II secretion system F family protein [Methylobacteriaceae bacterium]|nr:type II secretion system F family protein [Methylobacteriaceae bacterium]